MHNKLKKCPVCGSTKIHLIREEFKAIVQGKKMVIPYVERQKCFSCGEEFFDHKSNENLDAFRQKRRSSAKHCSMPV
jgi:YgiT-type zinc finger domain-containing protein